MKVKYSIIPFIPVAIAMVGLKIMSLFGLDSNGLFLGMNKTGITYLVISLALGLFVVCVLINLFDRKTAPVYNVKKNYAAAIFSVLSGVAVAGSSFVNLINTPSNNTDSYLMSLIVAVFSIPAAIALVLMCKVHFTGKSTVSGISSLYIFPALWGCSALVSEFLKATKVSISASDMTPLFCYIFITLYFFSHAMIVSRIKGRNPVKACFIYGLPCVAISLAYGVYVILTSTIENSGIQSLLTGAQFIMLALYAASFIIEMFFGTLTKDEVEIIDSLPEEEDTYENSYISSGGYDELLVSGNNDSKNERHSNDKFKPDLSGLDDFIMGYNDDEKNDIIFAQNKTDADKGTQQADNIADNSAPEVLESAEESVHKSVAEFDALKTDFEVDVAQEPEQKKPETLQFKTEPTFEQKSDLSVDDVISNERISQIDKLLEELENKKNNG